MAREARLDSPGTLHHVARPLRIEYPGAFYHITARGNERKKIFFAKSDYDRFKSYLKEAEDKYCEKGSGLDMGQSRV